jgi:CO/xanthine dehydrogenase Mo-binding subunit
VLKRATEIFGAMVMDVVVDSASGKIGVRRVPCAHDYGLVVNPNGLPNQLEGSTVQTLSRTLHAALAVRPDSAAPVPGVGQTTLYARLTL